MNRSAQEFADAVRAERDSLMTLYFEGDADNAVKAKIDAAELSPSQREAVESAFFDGITDAYFHLLSAFDGSASLGGKQQNFMIVAEDGAKICDGSGYLEAAAYEALHESLKG